MIRNAGSYARRLLQVAPDAADAYLVLGAANYIIGSQALHKRLFLRFAGIRGDKGEGIQQLEIVAARGRYPGRSRRFCWRWPPCARSRPSSPERSRRSSSRSFRKTRCSSAN